MAMAMNNEYLEKLLTTIRSELENSDMMGSYVEQTVAFFKAVDWTESWILGVLGFHIVCFIIAIGLRNQHDSLSVYFFILLGLAALTQPLNSAGMEHWKLFANQPYFDASGIFVVSVYSFPLIFNGFVTLMFILKATVSVLVQTKRAQLRQKIRNSQKETNKNTKKMKEN